MEVNNLESYLKSFRKQKEQTQSEFAANLGFTESHYVKIELGVSHPGLNFLYTLKQIYPEFDINKFFEK